jgi:predicted dehydrogenase
MGGGQGQIQVTHAAALVHFITGLKPIQVAALMDNLDVALDVIDAFTVRMSNGALANIGSVGNLQVSDPGKLSLQVNCDHGWLDMDFITGAGRLRRADGTDELFPALDAAVPPVGSELSALLYPLYAPANNLVDVISNAGVNESNGEIGWRTVELLEAAYRSSESQGQIVSVQQLYE